LAQPGFPLGRFWDFELLMLFEVRRLIDFDILHAWDGIATGISWDIERFFAAICCETFFFL
jgi:hypothetical protein